MRRNEEAPKLFDHDLPQLASAIRDGQMDEDLAAIGMDSLDVYTLYTLLDDVAGGSLSEEVPIAGLRTVRDAVDLHSALKSRHE